MYPTDREIIDALIAKEPRITHDFFFVWARPLLFSLIRKIFNYDVEYEELVNDLYVYLMENDARRLRSFQGRSSIYQWLKCVATRYFLKRRDCGMVIENKSSEPLYPVDEPDFEPVEKNTTQQDIRRILLQIPNARYRHVLQRLLLDDVEYEALANELNTSVANLYNIKARAWAQFTAIVLKEYGNG